METKIETIKTSTSRDVREYDNYILVAQTTIREAEGRDPIKNVTGSLYKKPMETGDKPVITFSKSCSLTIDLSCKDDNAHLVNLQEYLRVIGEYIVETRTV